MTKTVKKVVAGISALVILGGAAVGAWAVVENSRSSYPSFDQIEADKEYTADLGEGVMDEGGAEISETVENGVQLMSAKIEPKDFAANGISPMAETAYQLTATITPANATNKAVDWSVAFVNPSSEWASGKSVTNYVTVTPTSDGALTANVECKQAFGEQIKVTVTSRTNSDVSASCTVDYVKRVESLNASFSATELQFNSVYNVTFSPIYSDGTLQGTMTSYSNADIQLTEGFKNVIESKMQDGYAETLTYYDPANFDFDSDDKTFSFGSSISSPFLAFANTSAPKPSFGDSADKMTSTKVRDDFNNAFTLAVEEYSDTQAVFTVDYVYSYVDKQYSTGTAKVNLKFDADDLVITVTGIELDEGSVIF